MKKTFFYIIGFLPGLLFCSCNKVLDKKPLDAVTSNDVFSSPANVAIFMNNIYSYLPNGFNRGWAMLDAGTSIGENSYDWPGIERFNSENYDATNAPLNDWTNNYKQIANCNTAIANMASLSGSNIDVLKGEAYFLRAFLYQELYKAYGGLVLITKPLTSNEAISQTRSTVDETVNQIVADCDKAASLLPNILYTGRATKVAALALKGRVLLYAQKYDLSATASKAAMDAAITAGYDLYTPYANVFIDPNNKEIIFDKQLSATFGDRDGNGNIQDMWNSPNGFPNGWGGTGPSQNLVDKYEMQPSGKPITDMASGYNPQDPFKNRDPRFDATVLHNGSTYRGAVVDTRNNGLNRPDGNGDATQTGYYMRKFMDESVIGPTWGHVGKAHWIYIRLAEVYLNYAEAQLKLATPNTTEALMYVNKVRTRAGMPPLAAADLTWDRYMNERTIELAFEEQFFWDVRRWKTAMVSENLPLRGMRITGTSSANYVYRIDTAESRTFKTRDYVLPIPKSEIDKNPGLTQNAGW